MVNQLPGRERSADAKIESTDSRASSSSVDRMLSTSNSANEIAIRPRPPRQSGSDNRGQSSRMDVYFPRPVQRPASIYQVVIVALLSIGTLAFTFSPFKSTPPTSYAERTKHLMSTTPLIDGHNDMPHMVRKELANKIYDISKFTLREGLISHTDLVKLKQGGVGGQFWSVYIPCLDEDILMDEPTNFVRDTLEQIDVSKRIFEEYDEFTFCRNSSCVTPAFAAGRLPSMLGAEGLHQVGGSLATIRQLFELGVRYITLTHNCNNHFATCATHVAAGGFDSGLTDFGIVVVKEMNRLGMMVDLSHVSVKTMEDSLRVTRSPVIFSHSSARALSDHARNVPDHVLRRVTGNRGVVMITFVPLFLNVVSPESANIDLVVDHIFHIAKIAGWDHVGIGGDFDGTPKLPPDIQDVSAYPDIIEAVLRRGATDEQVRKLLSENILRVWKENEEVSLKLRQHGEKAGEESFPGRKLSVWDGKTGPWMFPR